MVFALFPCTLPCMCPCVKWCMRVFPQGVVCTLHEGDDFGKLALVTDSPRAASIVLREDNCHFLRVDKEDFNRILRVRRIIITCIYQGTHERKARSETERICTLSIVPVNAVYWYLSPPSGIRVVLYYNHQILTETFGLQSCFFCLKNPQHFNRLTYCQTKVSHDFGFLLLIKLFAGCGGQYCEIERT